MNENEQVDYKEFPCGAVMWREGKTLRLRACCPTCLVLEIFREEAALEGVPVFEPMNMN